MPDSPQAPSLCTASAPTDYANMTHAESSAQPTPVLTYTLRSGSVLKLSAPTHMVLVVVGGAAWVTLGTGPHGEVAGAAPLHPGSGDAVVQAGQKLGVAAGRYAVLESLGDGVLEFAWVPHAQAAPQQVSKAAPVTSSVGVWIRRLLRVPNRRQRWQPQALCA